MTNVNKNYNVKKVDDLKMFLLNEAWEPCPVRHDFDFSQLREFKVSLETSIISRGKQR